MSLWKRIQEQCHRLQDRYGTKYIFVAIAIALGVNILFSSTIFYFQENLNSWFDSVYWTITTLSTVGYGDVLPTTVISKCVAMFNMIFGIALFPMFGGMIVGLLQGVIMKKNEVANECLQAQNAEIIELNKRILAMMEADHANKLSAIAQSKIDKEQ